MSYARLLFVLSGVLGYFAIVFTIAAWLPTVRNDAIPNWILIALGLALSILAVRRAQPGRRVPRVLLGANVSLAALFAFFLYGFPVVPDVRGPAVGVAAPDFDLVDHTGKTVRLADFRGSQLLLVFYRGHW